MSGAGALDARSLDCCGDDGCELERDAEIARLRADPFSRAGLEEIASGTVTGPANVVRQKVVRAAAQALGYLDEVARLRRERDDAREELGDIKDSYRSVVGEPCNEAEVHCSCVPALRAELRAWEEREAAVVPEDVGFEEYIVTLQSRNVKLERQRGDLKSKLMTAVRGRETAEAEAARLREVLERCAAYGCHNHDEIDGDCHDCAACDAQFALAQPSPSAPASPAEGQTVVSVDYGKPGGDHTAYVTATRHADGSVTVDDVEITPAPASPACGTCGGDEVICGCPVRPAVGGMGAHDPCPRPVECPNPEPCPTCGGAG